MLVKPSRHQYNHSNSNVDGYISQSIVGGMQRVMLHICYLSTQSPSQVQKKSVLSPVDQLNGDELACWIFRPVRVPTDFRKHVFLIFHVNLSAQFSH